MKPDTKNLFMYFNGFAEERPCDTFLFDEHNFFTVSQAFDVAKSLAVQLKTLGITSGSRVDISADRNINVILCFFALQFIGANTILHDPREFLIQSRYAILNGMLYADESVFLLDFSVKKVEFIPFENSKLSTITIFTSGSTGQPKSVNLSQYNFINNSLDTADIGGYYPDDINIDIVPIHHVFGLALIFTAVVTRHAIFVPCRVDAEYIVDCIIKYGATRLNGIPSLYIAMAESMRAIEIKSLRYGLIGGAPWTGEQFERVEKKLGITLIPVYGMSECVGISCGSYSSPLDIRSASVGKVYSMNKVKIDECDEILVKSPAMALGVADKDGWLHTGDLGYFDEQGYLHISGRKKNIIIRNGNNLSPVAIEQKLLALPGVKDVCVVGIKDEMEGEVPAVVVVVEGDICLNKDTFEHLLIKPEMPKYIKKVNSIPLTSSGKQDRLAVLQMFKMN